MGFFILIIMGSSIPGKKIPHFFTLTPDKLIHCTEYFILGILMLRWLVAEFPHFYWKKTAAYVLIIVAACGAIDEMYQNLTPNRTPDFYDWCLDFIGSILSVLVFATWRKLF